MKTGFSELLIGVRFIAACVTLSSPVSGSLSLVMAMVLYDSGVRGSSLIFWILVLWILFSWATTAIVITSVRILCDMFRGTPPTPPTLVEKRVVPVWNNGKKSELEL